MRINMTEKGKISRERIIEAANHLVYIKGFNQTSIADVANAVGITKGNLNYHFKSKEELLEAIVQFRIVEITEMLKQWDEKFPDAKVRLKRFVKMLLNEEKDIVRYGCPMGSLNTELGKFQLSLRDSSREMFDLFQHWLEKVFKQLDGSKKSKERSQHLLSMAQGAALMSYIYSDKKILKNECKSIDEWIDSVVSN